MQNPTNVMEKGDEQVKSTKKIILTIFVVIFAVLCLLWLGVALILLISFWCPIVTFINLPQLCAKAPIITNVDLMTTTTTKTTINNVDRSLNKTEENFTQEGNYTEFNFTLEKATDLFKTSKNCNFPVNDIGVLHDVDTLRSCGEACVANPNCNRFSFMQNLNCYLKKWPVSNPPPYVTGSYSCGYVIDRPLNKKEEIFTMEGNYDGFTLEKATDLFKTSTNCEFPFYEIAELNNVSTSRSCGEACVANRNCNRFSYLNHLARTKIFGEIGEESCILNKWPDSNKEQPKFRLNSICGYIVNRPVKSIPTPGPLAIAAGMLQSDDQI